MPAVAIYLTPGDYAVLAAGFGAPATITVTGEADATAPVASGVTADATITGTGTSGGFDFVAASLPAGAGVIEIVNESDQPHFVLGIRSDVPFTDDEVIALLSEEEPGDGATPEVGAGGPPPVAPGFITGTQSVGATQYVAVDDASGVTDGTVKTHETTGPSADAGGPVRVRDTSLRPSAPMVSVARVSVEPAVSVRHGRSVWGQGPYRRTREGDFRIAENPRGVNVDAAPPRWHRRGRR